MSRQVTPKYIWLRKAFKQLKEDYGNTCNIKLLDKRLTGSVHNNKLEFAHLHPTKLNGMGRGYYERYKDIISNPYCYVLLCKNHHKMFDNGELKL